MLSVTGSKEFKKKLDDFTMTVKEVPLKTAKKIILNILKETILQSPVDTGRLVGGWQISFGSSSSFEDATFTETKKSENQERSKVINKCTEKLLNFGGSGILWFANNVIYVEYNEFGTEKITGKFMFTNAITSTKNRINELIK